MIFNSLAFFVFFPLVTLAYFATPHRARWVVLLAASYFFYGYWKPRYLFFLVLSTTVDWAVALGMSRVGTKARKRALLVVSLVANFGLLFVFKYLRFATTSLEWVLHRAGSSAHLPIVELVLPIGISFYTFQTVSYVLDVYAGEREPERHLGKFALFVSFFPHLVAGPIVRARKLLPQFSEEHRWDVARVASGLGWMLWGMFKKVVIADRAAWLVSAVYRDPERYQGPTLVLATYAFAFQIYCDFSGYSDIAIGAARVLGIELTKNFDDPYSSSSLAEFWRRWHISLSTWFRDYVYVPLGGNRRGPLRRTANLLVVFLLSGLWHGANWTFVVWGAVHGVALVVEHAIRDAVTPYLGAGLSPFTKGLVRFTGRLVTFHVACFGWVFFRASDVGTAMKILSRLDATYPLGILEEICRAGDRPREAAQLDLSILVVSIVALELVNGLVLRPGRVVSARARAAGFAVLSLWVLLTAVQSRTPFIYFQF
jgi:D-alanyl-lipoteichoic acid acyltransferase DltB (MBOAT superfamily)